MKFISILLLTFSIINASASDPRYYSISKSSVHAGATAISTLLLAKYIWCKYNPKRRRRYCHRCICDLTLWDIVDRKKIVEPVDCFVCGVPE